MVIGWAGLRGEPNFLAPDQIVKLEIGAAEVLAASKALRELSKQPRFRQSINPKRIRHAFLNTENLSDWRREIEKADKS
jgi:hypothetical protein